MHRPRIMTASTRKPGEPHQAFARIGCDGDSGWAIVDSPAGPVDAARAKKPRQPGAGSGD